MKIEEYTTEVIKRCEPLDAKTHTLIGATENMLYGASILYFFMKVDSFQFLSIVSKYNDSLLLNFSKKEQLQISFSSRNPDVFGFMLMFFCQCKKQDAAFSVFNFLKDNGVIKNTLVKEMEDFWID